MNDGVQLFLRPEREAMEDCCSKSSAWWFKFRLCPIHPSHVPMVMPTICILSVANNDACVQE
jgi:hypothetical protein